VSHPKFLDRHRARVSRVATILVISSAISVAHAAQPRRQPPQPSQAAQSSGAPAKKEHSLSEKVSEAFTKQLKPLQDKQDWAGMLALLDTLQVAPGSYDEALILDMKAKLYATTNQLSKAIAPWEKSIELSDQHGYFTEKQVNETIALLAQLYGQEASTVKVPPEGQPGRQQALAQQQQYFGKAIQYFKRYLEKTPKPTPEMMMAYASILYYKAAADPNKLDQALLKEARQIVEQGLMTSIKPKEGFYQLLLTLQQQQNDLAGSSEILELLLKQSPNKKDYWQMLMAIYLQLSEKARTEGKDEQAAKDYVVRAIVTAERAQALGHLQTPKDNMNLVSLYLMANQFTKGTELLYNGMKSGKIESEPNNWRVLGRYYMEANQNDQAIKVLNEAAKLFPKNGEIELQIAQLYIQMEKPKEALQHAKAAVQKGNFDNTKPFAAHYLVAYTAYDLGLLDEAAKAIEVAEKFPEAAKDPQFPKLKNVVVEAITERENRAKEKAEKEKKDARPPKKSATGG
jgi:tetratricopeptide (TPR) repeat protein